MITVNIQTSSQSEFVSDSGIPAVIKNKPRYTILQSEFSTVTTDGYGKLYAKGKTPFEVLKENGVIPIGYVIPWLTYTSAELSGPAFYLRRMNAKEAETNNYFLKDTKGYPITFGTKKEKFIDIGNDNYLNYLINTYKDLPIDHYFIDIMFYHLVGYIGFTGNHEKIRLNLRKFAQSLRDSNSKVWANAAWEMVDPQKDVWEYYYQDAVDGIVIEVPTGLSALGQNWWTLYSYTNMTYTAKLERLINEWQDMGKEVLISAKYDPKVFRTYDNHCSFWAQFCIKNGCGLSTHVNTNGVWWSDTLNILNQTYTEDEIPSSVNQIIQDIDKTMEYLRQAKLKLQQLQV